MPSVACTRSVVAVSTKPPALSFSGPDSVTAGAERSMRSGTLTPVALPTRSVAVAWSTLSPSGTVAGSAKV